MFGMALEGHPVNQLFVRSALRNGSAGETKKPTTLPLNSVTRSKIMKKLQPIVCAGIVALAVSGPALAKPGTISTTKAGIISTTKTGTISTTRTGIISTTAVGTISTTHTGLVSTSHTNSTAGSDRFSFVELLLSFFGQW
jgi:hypothetical protein